MRLPNSSCTGSLNNIAVSSLKVGIRGARPTLVRHQSPAQEHGRREHEVEALLSRERCRMRRRGYAWANACFLVVRVARILLQPSFRFLSDSGG